MLKQRGDKIVWGEVDMMAMAEILGPETAAKGKAPVLASVLRAAKRRRLRLDDSLTRQLDEAIALRIALKKLKRLDDAPTVRPDERKAFAHQRADLHYIRKSKLPAYLIAHQPGVGKTLDAILWATAIVKAKRILVICPNSAKRQWRREIRRWSGRGRRITIVEGSKSDQVERAQTTEGWVIGHWESLVHAADGYLDERWDAIILDEAHHIQNRKAQRSETVFDLEGERRLALTGHPFANQPDELFSILRFLYPQTYTSFWRFFGMHVKVQPKPFGGFEVLGARHPKLLRWEIAPFLLRKTKKQVFKNLPPITRIPIEVELSARGKREYERLRKQIFVELDGLEQETKVLPIINDLSRVTRLRQYLIDPALVGAREPSVKFPEVASLIRDLDGPIVLFSMYREALVNLTGYLAKQKIRRVAMIAGKMKGRDKDRIQLDFLRGKYDALLVVTQAGGTALNLGKYGYVGHLDLPWNPKDLEQTEGRVDRPEEGTGKLVPTTSWRIVVQDSYEERMEAKLEKKHRMFGEVFTVGELRRLFAA
jgi:SNF2 family DNA or RNA helicase